MIPPLYKHQARTVDFYQTSNRVFDTSDPGCVSADTEYLSPEGWRRIDAYDGGRVAQFLPDTRTIEFVAPTEYIKRPCKEMLVFQTQRGVSMKLSAEHRVLYYDWKGAPQVLPAATVARAHSTQAAGFRGLFANTFAVNTDTALDLPDAQIRLMVAVIADGSFHRDCENYCCIRVKKERKKQRLRELFAAAAWPYKERECGGQTPGFTSFTFRAPWVVKYFDERFWRASKEQLALIATELPLWDGSLRKAGAADFSSCDKRSADFAQFAFAAAGRTTTLNAHTRERRGRTEIEYVVHARAGSTDLGLSHRDREPVVENTEDGFKYCFEVPSSFLLLRRDGCIFATGNTGKTRTNIEDIVRSDDPGPTLVLAPKSILQPSWGDDIEAFSNLSYVVATAKNRTEAFNQDVDVYITNHDAVRWLVKNPKTARLGRFHRIIVDEITAFKHATSQRSKALAKLIKTFEVRRGLTGTPNANGVLDLWHQVYLLDDGERLGPRYWPFRATVCEPVQVGRSANAIRWDEKPGARDVVGGLIADITVRNVFEDCLDIPPNKKTTVHFELSPKHRKLYDQFQRDALLELEAGDVTATHAGILANKLLQIASGAVYDENHVAQVLASERYELVMDLVEERTACLVAFNWRHQREQLEALAKARKLPYAVIDGTVSDADRQKAVRQFQAGALRLILAQPQSASHGLTLTRGTATIWASPVYDAERYEQFCRRIYRATQTRATETIHVAARGTIDEPVFEKLTEKMGRMGDMLSLLNDLQAA